MTKTASSAHDRNQLAPSIEKLLHYLAVYVVRDTTVTVYGEDGVPVFEHEFLRPRAVSISPTLYTRLDDCHGAGNCCRVPFDLVYTDYDRQRILDYSEAAAIEQFGTESAMGFSRFKDDLLGTLVALRCVIRQATGSVHQQSGELEYETTETRLWVKRNTTNFHLSGKKSCPYLITGSDRYFCGVHPFKPLHCWYPHMTVRVTKPRAIGDRPSVSIGRMQYGRNHNFGCPVLFEQTGPDEEEVLFAAPASAGRPSYFKSQFQSDLDKLEWTSRSAESMGFTPQTNVAVGLHDRLAGCRATITKALANNAAGPINLLERN